MTVCKKIQLVIVGMGLIGPRHAAHVISNPDTELFAVIDPSETGEKAAKALNARYMKSISRMIEYCHSNAVPYPDGAIVCTPSATHVKIAAELASYKINLLVEKPLSSSVEDSMALREYATQQGIALLVGHHRRFNPFIIETKNNLKEVGNIVAVQGTWALQKNDSYFEASPWRIEQKKGGGVILINLVHDIDILQYLFGPVDEVYASLLVKQRLEFPNADEGAALVLKFKSGVCGTFICSDNVVSPFNFESGTGENPTVPFHEGLEGFYRVFGSKGTLSIPDLNLYHQKTGGQGWLSPVIKESLISSKDSDLRLKLPFDLQLNHFVDVIRKESEPQCNADDGISAILCVEAVTRSIETGLLQKVQDINSVKPNFNSLK
ncbi:uncharacterized protein PRCAT00000014001 [Priceomyces carsonii]|uniref:uncharacterized protein n=1 Tax=Priceomyces carsonii TaxID=28549 RepID=UPI002ED86C5F|nr:unnamed protein product [Priceomyces carsonii]